MLPDISPNNWETYLNPTLPDISPNNWETYLNPTHGGDTLKRYAKYYNIPVKKIKYTMRKENVDIERAVDIILSDNDDKYIHINGMEFPSLQKACNRLQINSDSIRKIGKMYNLSHEEALKFYLYHRRPWYNYE